MTRLALACVVLAGIAVIGCDTKKPEEGKEPPPPVAPAPAPVPAPPPAPAGSATAEAPVQTGSAGSATGSATGQQGSATAPKPVDPPASAAGKIGEACGAGDRCAEGTCVTYYGIAGPRGPQFKSCEIKCDGGKACPGKRTCMAVADGPGMVCR